MLTKSGAATYNSLVVALQSVWERPTLISPGRQLLGWNVDPASSTFEFPEHDMLCHADTASPSEAEDQWLNRKGLRRTKGILA